MTPVISEQEDKPTAVRRWLHFPRQHARKDKIEHAHEKTFSWVFEHRGPDGQRVTFAEWLRTENGLYWIKGKPGSGKSTLIKMLSEHSRTRELLTDWTHGDPCVLCPFYFWSAGTEMQRALSAFFRTVLCDILKVKPSLVDVIFPDWQPEDMSLEPALEEVRGAFERALDAIEIKVCLFVDGLDEYEGDSIEMANLGEFIMTAVKRVNVKAVVSSRQLPALESVFLGRPSLAIHELTRKDIRSMVTSTLQCDHYVDRLRAIDPCGLDDLTGSIAERSSGVFLWAVWAVRIILDGARVGDCVEDLLVRLKDLPADLKELFTVMLGRVKPRFQRESWRFLQIALFFYVKPDKFARYQYGALESLNLGLAADVEEVTQAFWQAKRLPSDYAKRYRDRVSRRLHSATQGLLEERHDSQVEFMHRSVVDFLRDENLRIARASHARNEQEPDFDPATALLMAYAIGIRLAPEPQRAPHLADLHLDDMKITELGRCKNFERYELIFGYTESHYHLQAIFWLIDGCAKMSGNTNSAIITRVLKDCAQTQYWNRCFERYFLRRAMYWRCETWLADRLRSEGRVIFQRHPHLLADVICIVPHKDMRALSGSRTNLVALSLEQGADPNRQDAVYRRYTFFKFFRKSYLGDTVLYPWEMALLHTLAYLFDLRSPLSHRGPMPSRVSFRQKQALENFLDLLNVFHVMLEWVGDLHGSSEVAKLVAQLLDLEPPELTVSEAFQLMLDARCPVCVLDSHDQEEDTLLDSRHLEVDALLDSHGPEEDILAVSACACETAIQMREQIALLLEKLDERSKQHARQAQTQAETVKTA